MAVESESPSFVPIGENADDLSEEAKEELRAMSEKYSDLIANADVLPQPMRAIAQFVKKEGGERGKEDERG